MTNFFNIPFYEQRVTQLLYLQAAYFPYFYQNITNKVSFVVLRRPITTLVTAFNNSNKFKNDRPIFMIIGIMNLPQTVTYRSTHNTL